MYVLVTASDRRVTGSPLFLGYARAMRAAPKSGRYLTLPEVSRQTGLEPLWLRRLCQRGALPTSKAGRDWLVKQEDLADFVSDSGGMEASVAHGRRVGEAHGGGPPSG